MEGNRDESEKCINLAKKHIDTGDIDKAVRFLQKAERLYPSTKAKDLLEKIEREKTDGGTEKAEQETQPTQEPTPERRNSKPDCHDLQPKYTQDQLEAVRKIRKCKDYYEILGLTKECTDEDLKKAYKKLALKFHPDKNHAPGATEAFKAIGSAFSVLSDPAKRQRYDEYGIEDSSATRRRQNGYEFDYSRGFEGDVSAEELFRMFFGGSAVFTSGHARRQASAASHNRSRERSDSPYTMLLQLSPLICMIVLSLLSSFMVGQAQYSLRRDSKYTTERKTSNLGVSYYVRSDFATGKDSNEIFSIERQVEEDYVVELQHACYRERNNRENALWRAQMYGNNDLYFQAKNMRMPSCDRLRTINGG